MASKHLATYLNDHLAGSVMAVELLGNLEAVYAGTNIEQFAKETRTEVHADQKELQGLMDRLSISQSITRRTSAWLTEKMAELKMRVDDPASGAFRLMQTAEALSLGIEGKRSLWIALQAAVQHAPELAALDYSRLIGRAEAQRSRVEGLRVDSAKNALNGEF